ncbi:MAG TPA: phosphotransferase [Bacilli bacterium]|nr:phosphotransferase [Bacilli bacterium]
MINAALNAYGLHPDLVVVERELPRNWHGDLHYKLRAEGAAYYLRFLASERYQHEAFRELTDERLSAQMAYCDYMTAHELPFMKRIPPRNGEAFVVVEDAAGKPYRCVLFTWIEGVHLKNVTPEMAGRLGALARRFHDESVGYETNALPFSDHTEGQHTYLKMMRERMTNGTANLLPEEVFALEAYLALAESYVKQGARAGEVMTGSRVMQTDLNHLNVLWDKAGTAIQGVIDFEHLFYSERVQELPWLLKWYGHSPTHAQALLEAYGAREVLTDEEWRRLPALLWLSGCLNWNFTAKTLALLETDVADRAERLQAHLDAYRERGQTLLQMLIASIS